MTSPSISRSQHQEPVLLPDAHSSEATPTSADGIEALLRQWSVEALPGENRADAMKEIAFSLLYAEKFITPEPLNLADFNVKNLPSLVVQRLQELNIPVTWPATSFSDLPDEHVAHIASYLSTADKKSLRVVARRERDVVTSNWLETVNIGSSYQSDQLNDLIRKGLAKHVKHLKVDRTCAMDNGENKILNIPIAQLNQLTQLESLDISAWQALPQTSMTDKAIAHITASTAVCKSLKRLNLRYNAKITDAGIQNLSKLTSLTELNVCGTKITGAGLAHIKGLSGLTALRLGGCEQLKDEDLQQLATLTSLTELDVGFPNLTGEGLKYLTGLTGLTKLDLSGRSLRDDHLQHLTPFTSLIELDMSCTGITGEGLAHLTGLTALAKLCLWRCKQLKGEHLKHLSPLKSLIELELGWTNIAGASLAHLQGLSGLAKLGLRCCTKLRDEDLQHLAPLTALTEIAVHQLDIFGSGMSNFWHMQAEEKEKAKEKQGPLALAQQTESVAASSSVAMPLNGDQQVLLNNAPSMMQLADNTNLQVVAQASNKAVENALALGERLKPEEVVEQFKLLSPKMLEALKLNEEAPNITQEQLECLQALAANDCDLFNKLQDAFQQPLLVQGAGIPTDIFNNTDAKAYYIQLVKSIEAIYRTASAISQGHVTPDEIILCRVLKIIGPNIPFPGASALFSTAAAVITLVKKTNSTNQSNRLIDAFAGVENFNAVMKLVASEMSRGRYLGVKPYGVSEPEVLSKNKQLLEWAKDKAMKKLEKAKLVAEFRPLTRSETQAANDVDAIAVVLKLREAYTELKNEGVTGEPEKQAHWIVKKLVGDDKTMLITAATDAVSAVNARGGSSLDPYSRLSERNSIDLEARVAKRPRR